MRLGGQDVRKFLIRMGLEVFLKRFCPDIVPEILWQRPGLFRGLELLFQMSVFFSQRFKKQDVVCHTHFLPAGRIYL